MSKIAGLGLEGVLVPEIWINVAERPGIDTLRATTRDIPDYSVLMRQRLRLCDDSGDTGIYGLAASCSAFWLARSASIRWKAATTAGGQ
ncbi:MAG: hypothetical protein OSA84_12155, partial [Akkermansiaceae bacterium]|nr:hypothetical protein [Akkermansiaceae bacterium]